MYVLFFFVSYISRYATQITNSYLFLPGISVVAYFVLWLRLTAVTLDYVGL
jgi:hypothetical protein